MPQVIAVHSYRRGTGKTSITVNLATIFTMRGKSVAILDAASQTASTHFFFNWSQVEVRDRFNDFMDGKCEIEAAVYNLTTQLKTGVPGQLFVAPAHPDYHAPWVEKPFPVDRLAAGINHLIEILSLDILLLDTSAGLQDAALLPMVLADLVIEVLRLDQQDYQGTAVMTQIARELDIPRVFLVANMVPSAHDRWLVKREIEAIYHLPVASVIPLAEDLLAFADGAIFVEEFPDHPFTLALEDLARRIR